MKPSAGGAQAAEEAAPAAARAPAAQGPAASLGGAAGAKPLRRGLLLLSVVLAFRGALWAKELLLGLGLTVAACPGVGFTFKPGGGLHVHGLQSCQGGAALAAGLFGMFAGALLAVPILVVSMLRKGRPINQFLATTGYLFGLASAVEVLSATLVFPLLNRFEAAAVDSAGLSRFLLLPVGLALGYLFWWLSMQTSRRFVVAFLGWPDDKVAPFKKAVIFKLSVGTLLVSALRLFVG